MPIKITQKLGNKKKQFNVLTKEELSELFGGNIARAGEALGRQAELDKNLGILNDEKLPELDSKLTQLDKDLGILDDNLTELDTELGVLEGNLTELDTELGNLDDKLYDLDTGDIPQLNEELGTLDDNLTQLDKDLGILDDNLTELDTELGVLDGYFDDPSTIPSNYNFFSGIVAEQAWIDSLVANQAWLDNLFVNEAFADRITANEILAGTITANEISSNTITANEILADTITSNQINVSELVASNVFANTFVANEGYVDQLISNDVFANKITAKEVDIADLFAQTISVGGTISGNYSSTTGWRIQGNGNAEFNNVTVRGSGSSVADWQVQESNRSLFKTIPNTDFSYVHITNEPWGGDVTAGTGVRFANGDLNSDTQVKYAHVGQLHELDSNSFTGNADASDAEWGIEVMLGQGSSSYKHIFRAGNGGVLLTSPNDDFLINEDGFSIRSTTIEAGITQRTYSILHGQTEVGSIYGFSTSSRDAIQISANDGWDLQIGADGGGSVIMNSPRFRVPRTVGQPSNLENGMIWYDNTQSRFLKYEDGSVSFL